MHKAGLAVRPYVVIRPDAWGRSGPWYLAGGILGRRGRGGGGACERTTHGANLPLQRRSTGPGQVAWGKARVWRAVHRGKRPGRAKAARMPARKPAPPLIGPRRARPSPPTSVLQDRPPKLSPTGPQDAGGWSCRLAGQASCRRARGRGGVGMSSVTSALRLCVARARRPASSPASYCAQGRHQQMDEPLCTRWHLVEPTQKAKPRQSGETENERGNAAAQTHAGRIEIDVPRRILHKCGLASA